MLSFSFKNRIAFNYILSSSILIAIVFFSIIFIFKYTVNQHINEEIQEELYKHLDDVSTDSNDTYLIQVDQWAAREHNTVDINPVFVQFLDSNRELIDKSPNLKSINLVLQTDDKNNTFFNTTLNNEPIRQIQKPIIQNNKLIAYVIIAMSIDDFDIVIKSPGIPSNTLPGNLKHVYISSQTDIFLQCCGHQVGCPGGHRAFADAPDAHQTRP